MFAIQMGIWWKSQTRKSAHQRKMKPLKILLGMFGVLLVFSLLALLIGVFLRRQTLQTISSPDGRHEVRLVRQEGIDRNYLIYVDGTRVFVSRDFAPRGDIPWYEALRWDAAGSTIVFEAAQQRLFGYEVEDRRQLSDEELLAVEIAPEPALWEYQFEGEWPGVGRVRQFDPPPKGDK